MGKVENEKNPINKNHLKIVANNAKNEELLKYINEYQRKM